MQLFRYLLTVFIISFLLAWLASWFTNKGLLSSQVDFYGKMNAASDTGKQTNILLIGSSRALVHLDTRIIDSVTRLRSYNYGLNAVTIQTCFNIMQYAVYYQKHIKVAVLNIDYFMFDISQDPYKAAYYYPFEKLHHGFIMNDSTSNRLIHRLNFLDISLYDDFAKYAAIDGWVRPGRKVTGTYNGFLPHEDLSWFGESEEKSISKGEFLIQESGIQILNNMVELSKRNNIKLVFVIAPYYKKYFPSNHYTNYESLVDRIKQFAALNEALFLDYSSIPITNDKAYFYNANHLNVKGAAVFSEMVADTIKQYITSYK